jgi:integrase
MPGVDTATRYQAVFARHQQGCLAEADRARCNCRPRYFGTAWDRTAGRTRKTRHFPAITEARNARADLLRRLERGESPSASSLTLEQARTKFLDDVKTGVALNRRGRPYRPRAAEDLETALRHVPDEMARRRLVRITGADVQRLIDSKLEGPKPLSASRIAAIVHSLSSLYVWAEHRGYASFSPTGKTRLPAKDEKPRDRVVSPAEFAHLVEAIFVATSEEERREEIRVRDQARKDALPYALAAYGSARRQEVQVLDWEHVDLAIGAMELAADELGRKPGGSWRIVPLVKPLWQMLREEWLAQGSPIAGKVCPPAVVRKSGLLAVDRLQVRVQRRWRRQGHETIGLHECRHTCATWLDHAGVSPKVASEFVGHETAEYRKGAARITLQRYTHMLPGELEVARERFDAFLVERSGIPSIF